MTSSTSTVNGHKHLWTKGVEYTTFNAGHRHRIKGKTALPSRDGHKHKLLGKG